MPYSNVNFICWPATPAPADVVHDLIVEELSHTRIPVDAQNLDGDTLLHVASRNGAATTVRALLTLGTAVNVRNYAGQTPLDVAVVRNHDSVVRQLRAAGGRHASELTSACPSFGLSDFNQDGLTTNVSIIDCATET